MCYGYLNDVAHAREYLNKMRLDTYESREAYYNNSSALDIIDGKISDATIYSLNNALLLSKIDFTRIIIHSNLLICYTKMKKFEVAFEEVNYLTSKNIKVFHSETLQFMVYRNIMFYAEHTKNEALYEAYKRKMMKLIELDSMKESGLSEIGVAVISGKVDENHFYTKLGCYPEFICYWGVPLLLDSK